MTEKKFDIFQIAEVRREKKSKQVFIELKEEGSWSVFLCDSKGCISLDYPPFTLFNVGVYRLPLCENKRYYFSFVSGEQKFMIAEKLLPLEGASNFRDLGGINLLSDRRIKWGKIFRSDELSHLTDSDVEYLSSIELRSIIDYRSKHEIRKSTDRLVDSVQFQYSIPISPGAVKSSANPNNSNVETLTKQMENMYKDYILDAECINSFRLMFKILQYDLSTPLLLHCSAGKDRTGIATALILFALGASEEEVFADYLMSRKCIPTKYKVIVRKYPRMKPIFTVKKSYLRVAINEIKRNYGTIEFFLKNVLMVDLILLRRIYVEPLGHDY